MKKIVLLLLFLFSYNLTACLSEKTGTESSLETTTENEFNSEETENPEDAFSIRGFPVLLPENPDWIKNVEYFQHTSKCSILLMAKS